MKNINDFINEVAKGIEGATPCEVEKANGVILHGVSVPTHNANIKANVYVDRFFEDGDTVEDAIAYVKHVMSKESHPNFNIDWLYDWDKVRPHLTARLYNKKTKADVFKSAAEYGFDDLIIVPYINVSRNAAVKVTDEMVKTWKIAPDDIIDIAEQNSQESAKFQNLLEILGMPFLGELEMYVVTNASKTYGAYAVIPKLDEIRRHFPNGFTVLPSSVHEVIIVEKADNALTDIVQSVNAAEVAADEQLSDHAYAFTA